MVIIGGCLTGATIFMGYKFMTCPDVRVTPGKSKGEVLRTWA
jgi:hypothetical protein